MSMCNVLGVLGDSEDRAWETLNAAVALADAENARLTLVKTCDAARAYVWITPFACGGAYVPPPLDSPAEAARLLARVVEFVPGTIPLTTLVLGPDTQGSLVRLLRAGHYGAVVADKQLLAHCRRLRRELRREGIREIPVTPRLSEQPDGDTLASHISSSDTEVDGVQVVEGPGSSRSRGLRPWHARHLAGAGDKR
jgi:hypothetical protein